MAAAVLLAGAMAAAPGTASALGTPAGTVVTNNASVNYSVNGSAQAAVNTSTNFRVDDKVNFTVTASNTSNVTVLPAGTAYQTYVVSNIGNGPHDFTLSAAALGGNTLAPASGPVFYADAAGTTLLPTDANAGGLPYISNLATDGTRTVYLFITAPAQPADGAYANYSVTAESYQVNNLGAVNPPVKSATQAAADLAVDKNANLGNQYFVMSDGHGTGDADYDGLYTVVAIDGGANTVGFLAQSANLAVVKSSVLYSDPLNGVYNAATNVAPKAVPGATLIYTITVTNNGSAPTSALSISDTLPASLGFITYNDGPTSCAAGEVVVNGACTAANVTIAGQNLSVTGLSAAAGGGQTVVKYMVTIN
jgi:uncharacterized repeat protein (TIGR01451 family)